MGKRAFLLFCVFGAGIAAAAPGQNPAPDGITNYYAEVPGPQKW